MKTFAIFTMVRDEKVFLPIWLKYYSKYFNSKDIYVIDHETKDGSIEECKTNFKFNVKKVYNPYLFPRKFRMNTVKEMFSNLLKKYDYVIYTDVDEIIIPNLNKYANLRDYLNKFNKDFVYCNGFELIHFKDKEEQLDLNNSILKQRSYWYPNILYGKPLLSNKVLSWCAGFHNCKEQGEIDKNLLLIHLHKMDFDICLKKREQINKINKINDPKNNSYIAHNLINNKKELEQWFYKEKHIKNVKKLPKWLKKSNII